MKKDSKIDGGDSMSQKTNEDFNKKKPDVVTPDIMPPTVPPAPIVGAMRHMKKEPPKEAKIK